MLDEWWRSSYAVVNEIQPGDRGIVSSSTAFVNASLVHVFFSWRSLSVAVSLVRREVSSQMVLAMINNGCNTPVIHLAFSSIFLSWNENYVWTHTINMMLSIAVHSLLITFVFWSQRTVSRMLRADHDSPIDSLINDQGCRRMEFIVHSNWTGNLQRQA